MIVVVADTSPLNYLIQIHCEPILPALYDRGFVPAAVVQELDHPRAASAVSAWLKRVPRGLVNVDRALTDLQATDFRCTPRVIEAVRRRAGLSTY